MAFWDGPLELEKHLQIQLLQLTQTSMQNSIIINVNQDSHHQIKCINELSHKIEPFFTSSALILLQFA